MTWSYSGNPADSDKDAVRFCIGDTDESECLFSDEEIQYLLTTSGSVSSASIRALDKLCAKYLRCADETVGQVSVKWSQRFQNCKMVRDTMAKDPALQCPMPFSGGMSDCSNDKSIFTRHMNENPRAREDDFDPCKKC